MNVILAVTCIAVLRRFPIFLSGDMTLFAFDLLVFIAKRVVSLVVIEPLFVEQHDLGATPFVIGMTNVAGLRLVATVKACAGTHIRADFLVAAHAKSVLGLAVEFDVTLGAIVFPFHMGLNQLARSQNGLDSLRTCPHCKRTADPQYGEPKKEPQVKKALPSLQSRPHHSISVNGDHMHDRTDDQQVDEGHMRDVPQREQALIGGVLRYANHRL